MLDPEMSPEMFIEGCPYPVDTLREYQLLAVGYLSEQAMEESTVQNWHNG